MKPRPLITEIGSAACHLYTFIDVRVPKNYPADKTASTLLHVQGPGQDHPLFQGPDLRDSVPSGSTELRSKIKAAAAGRSATTVTSGGTPLCSSAP